MAREQRESKYLPRKPEALRERQSRASVYSAGMNGPGSFTRSRGSVGVEARRYVYVYIYIYIYSQSTDTLICLLTEGGTLLLAMQR